MKEIICTLLGLYFIGTTSSNDITVYNNCPFKIWPGIQGNPEFETPAKGGFPLDAYETRVVNVPSNWRGRIWARTQCDESSGHCETGDCGNKIECEGAGGNLPVSLAEITFNGDNGLDYYDVSLVDGFNLPINMAPINGYIERGKDKYDCTAAGCYEDINALCPEELAVKNDVGATIACNSACTKFNTDHYCCRGDNNTPDTCKSSDWPVDYPSIFKEACPDAYSYAYDDTTSTFTCKGNPNANYEVVFCPN